MLLLNLMLAGRLVVALVLVLAGVRKLAADGRAQLTAALQDYAVIPTAAIGAVAAVLPWLELSLGLLLGSGVLLVPAGVGASLLLGAFAAVVAWHTRRGRSFSCGCGNGGTINWSLGTRDLALSLIAAAGVAYPHTALAVWVGPGWIQAASGGFVSMIPVPMIVLLLAAGWRLLTVGSPLPNPPVAGPDVSAAA